MNVIEAAFVIADRGSGPVRRLRSEVRGLGRDSRRAGTALDELGGPRAARDLDLTASSVRGLRSELHDVPSGAGRAERALTDLDNRVMSAGRSAKGSSAYFSMLKDRTTLLGGAAVIALPTVQALGGATVALGGSLMGAGLGAGAVGLAGGGTLAAGVGAIAAVLAPAKAGVERAQKAQEAYTAAVAEFGRTSDQVALARRRMDAAMAAAPRGTSGFLAQRRAIGRQWSSATRGSQGDLLGLGADAIRTVRRRALPGAAADARVVTRATRTQGTALVDFATGPRAMHVLDELTRSFAGNLDEGERILEHGVSTLSNLAVASLPFFHEGMRWVDHVTGKWAEQTSDVTAVRRQVGGYVDDLKAWGHLSASAFDLAKDVLMGGRPAGTSMVRDLTQTFDSWDGWIRTHRPEVDHFFRDAAHDTEVMAGGLEHFAVGLNHIATELRPLLGPLSGLVSLAGGALGTLPPGVLASMWLGGRRMRNRRGEAPMVAGPGVMPTAPAGGGAASMLPWLWGGGRGASAAVRGGLTWAERGQRFAWARSMAGEGALWGGGGASATAAGLRAASRGLPSALAMRGLGALRGFSLPMLALTAGSEFMLTPGTFGERSGNALTLGGLLGDRVLTRSERRDQATTQAGRFGNVASIDRQVGHLQRTLADPHRKIGTARRFLSGDDNKFLGIGLGGNKITEQRRDIAERELAELIKRRRVVAQEERDERHAVEHARDVDLNARSRDHAQQLAQSFGRAFTLYDERLGPQKAMRRTLDGVYDKLGSMRRVGAKILGENTLAWAREQARHNPALVGEVNRLARRIEHRFSVMGDRVRVINDQILTGSRTQWQNIAAEIVSPANRALAETSAAYRDLRAQAVAELELMGFTHADAVTVFKSVRSGKVNAGTVNQRTGAGQSRLASDANKARSHGYRRPVGDGLGADTPAAPKAAAQRPAAGPSVSLTLPSLPSLTLEQHHHFGSSAPITRAVAHVSADTSAPGLLRVPLALDPMPVPRSAASSSAVPWEPRSAPLAPVVGFAGPSARSTRLVAPQGTRLRRPRLTAAVDLTPLQNRPDGPPPSAARTLATEINLDGSDPVAMRAELRRQLHANVEELVEVVMDSISPDDPRLSLVG